MIALRLEGRLGNQLFQYAFIYAASKKLNTSFYLDKSIENFLLPKYFEVENDFLVPLDNKIFSINGFKNVFKVHAKKIFYNLVRSIVFRGNEITIDNETPADEAFTRLKNNYIYKGFFHSESYFKDFQEDIRALYKIKKPHIDAYEILQKQLNISKRKTVVHIRRTDYVNLDMALPLSYYKKAIELINDNDAEYIFISDDPSFVETEFNYISNKYISTSSEIIDLQFLINADICILSNSSFSWWGAWLNNNPGRVVYAPKNWIGFEKGKEYPSGISDNLNVNWLTV